MDSFYSLYKQRRYVESEGDCRTALMKDASNLTARQVLIQALLAQGKTKAAQSESEAGLKRSQTDDQKSLFLHYHGSACEAAGEIDKSVDYFRKSLSLSHRAATAYMLSYTLLQTNQLKESAALAEKNLNDPRGLNDEHLAHVIYIYVKAVDKIDHDSFAAKFPAIRKDMAFPYFHFAMGLLRERQADYKQAFQHFSAGNFLLRKRSPTDVNKDLVEMKAHQQLFSTEVVATLEPVKKLSNMPIPIFILGMPRTGSSLLEQMLGAHSAVTPCGELPWMHESFEGARKNLTKPTDSQTIVNALKTVSFREEVRQRYFSNATDIHTEFLIDKLPGNFRYLFLIKAAFPEALVLHTQRDRSATIWSCFITTFSKGHRYSESLAECAHSYDRVESWIKDWVATFNNRLLPVVYEDLVAEPESTIRQILGALNLELEEACLTPHISKRIVNTASRQQVTRPIYKDANQSWQPYKVWVEAQTG